MLELSTVKNILVKIGQITGVGFSFFKQICGIGQVSLWHGAACVCLSVCIYNPHLKQFF